MAVHFGNADFHGHRSKLREEEVKLVIANLLGCLPSQLGRGAHARVVVTSLDRLGEVLGALPGAPAWPSMPASISSSSPNRLTMFGRAMVETEAAYQRVNRVTVGVCDDMRRRSARAIIRSDSGLTGVGQNEPFSPGRQWMLAEPIVLSGGQLWRVSRFSELGFDAASCLDFPSRKQAKSHMDLLGFIHEDSMALERLSRAPSFVRSRLVVGLQAEMLSGELTPNQMRRQLLRFDQDQSHAMQVGAQVAQAFYSASADRVVLIADHVARGSERAVYLHETVHKHARWVLGEDGFDRLVGQVQGWAGNFAGSMERQIYDAAHSRAFASTGKSAGGSLYREELLAYAVEEAVSRGVLPLAKVGFSARSTNAQEWLHDVVSTLQGVREQLLNGGPSLTMQEVVDMAYAMAQLDSPTRSEQIVQALLNKGEDLAFIEALKSFQKKSAFFNANTSLVLAIDGVYDDQRLEDVKACHGVLADGPFNGGSLACAIAIKQTAGAGEVIWIEGASSGPAQYGVEIGGFVYDFDGAHASRQAWLEDFVAIDYFAKADTYEVREGSGIDLLEEGIVTADCLSAAKAVGELLSNHFVRIQSADYSQIVPSNTHHLTPLNALPDCLIAASLEEMVVDDDYRLSRLGDEKAAMRLAHKVVTDDFVEALKTQVENAPGDAMAPLLLVPVLWAEEGSVNVSALAVAAVLGARLNAKVVTSIVQATHPLMGSTSAIDRVLGRPDFSGHVVPAMRYVVIDGRLHFGGAAASMARHIRAGGGIVASVGAMFGSGVRAKMTANESVLGHLRTNFGDLEDDFEKYYGTTFDGLTDAEARCLAAHRRPQEIRNRITEKAGQGGERQDGGNAERRRFKVSLLEGEDHSQAQSVGPFQSQQHNKLMGLVASFVGRKAIDHDPHGLDEAQSRLQAGEAPEFVFEETGWFTGPEGKWRFEIDDSTSSLLVSGRNWADAMPPGVVTVQDVLKHDRLFAAYPSLALLELEDCLGRDGALVSSLPRGAVRHEFRIQLGRDLSLFEARSVLLHELQHAVQAIEGFACGADLTKFSEVDVTERHVGPINEQIMALLDGNRDFGELRREHNRDFASILDAWGSKDERGFDRLNWDKVPVNRREVYFERMGRLEQFSENDRYIDLDMDRRRLNGERVVLSPWEQYQRQAGEVEARNVQTRRSMNDLKRRTQAPWMTQDTNADQVIVSFNRQEGLLQALPASDVTSFALDEIAQSKERGVQVGDWIALDWKDLNGTPVSQVRELELVNLYLPELDERGRLQPEKRSYLDDYARRLASGEVSPMIEVIEMEDGRMRVVDGHRRVMAAMKLGRSRIVGLVSPLVETPDGSKPATLELIESRRNRYMNT